MFLTLLAARTPQQQGSVACECTLTRSCYHTGDIQPTHTRSQHGHTRSCADAQGTTYTQFLHLSFAYLSRLKIRTDMELIFQKNPTAEKKPTQTHYLKTCEEEMQTPDGERLPYPHLGFSRPVLHHRPTEPTPSPFEGNRSA